MMTPWLLVSIACGAPGAGPAPLDWPQWRGPDRSGEWRGARLPEPFSAGSIEVVWREPAGAGFSGIAVAGRRVLTLDRKGRGTERVLCLDRESGRPLWVHEHAADYGDMDHGNGPRSTPTVEDGRVYAQGAVGHAFCLELETGKALWSADTFKTYGGTLPEWGGTPGAPSCGRW